MNSRFIAANILYRVVVDGQSLTVALDRVLPPLSTAKEKAFIQALCYGTLRYYHRLDFILNLLLTKPLKDMEVKILALVGLYQLDYMSVKPHAAVSETVSALRKKAWAKPLLNAVLRRYLRERDTLVNQIDKDPVAAASHPRWILERINKNWPDQAQQILAENNQQAAMALRVNLSQRTRTEYLNELADAGIAARQVSICPSAISLEKPLAVDALPGFLPGLVSVQDTAAQLATYLLNLSSGQRVLDVCAAPGGKTAHILETQANLAGLLAVDIDKGRLCKVEDNLRRLRLTAKLQLGDATAPENWWDGRPFDRILLDAPCSASGVIRRHPDIKLLRRADDIQQLRIVQAMILEALWPLLASGGLLLYATCSIFQQENEDQIQSFMLKNKDALEVPIEAEWGLKRKYGRQILTGELGMDGFYYARLRKK